MNQLLRSDQILHTENSRTPCRIMCFLGGGGQGEVYQADLQGTPVALKWYFSRNATTEQRFLLEDLIARGIKPGREDIQSLLTRLRTIGIATPEMAERAQLLFDGGTNDAFFGVMRDISTASGRKFCLRRTY